MNLSVFSFIQKMTPDLCPPHPHPCWKSQRPTVCSVLQVIVSTIVNLTFPNLHLRVMSCLLHSKHKQRIMNVAKLFQNHSANFQNKGEQKQMNSLRKIHTQCACMKWHAWLTLISGVHVWKWHGKPSQIRRACMKMAWWTLVSDVHTWKWHGEPSCIRCA